MKSTITLLVAQLLVPLVLRSASSNSFVPDFKIKEDDYTVLMAADATQPPGVKLFQAGAHGKFHVTDWTRPEQHFHWDVMVPHEDTYALNVLMRQHGNQPLIVEVSGAGQTLNNTVPTTTPGWTRYALGGTLRLPSGQQRLMLRAHAINETNSFNASVLSIELVRPAVREQLHAAAMKLRADTRWFQECRYGLMCHWTSQSFPRCGERKPYADAVQDFDVERFASQVKETGAGFVVFTTSHAQHFFPAPLKSLDGILAGRTAKRDLVAELAEALQQRGVRLFLYYHLGASSDPAWLDATGFWETDTSRLFTHWIAMIEEIGLRYGNKLAGWWFDDGAVNYYYRSAPWQRLATAAKAGHPGRLVAFNPWELPSPTEFQDYYCGEGNADPTVQGGLKPFDHGHISGGAYAGLQASAALLMEDDWLHTKRDTEIGLPRQTVSQLADLLGRFAVLKNVPILNCEIYQEGSLSPTTVQLIQAAARR